MALYSRLVSLDGTHSTSGHIELSELRYAVFLYTSAHSSPEVTRISKPESA